VEGGSTQYLAGYRVSNLSYVEFRVLIAEFMKSTVFWNIMPCSSVKVNHRSGWNISHPSSGSNKPSKIPAWKHVVILLGLFDHEDANKIII
jgi:hypothetical protein